MKCAFRGEISHTRLCLSSLEWLFFIFLKHIDLLLQLFFFLSPKRIKMSLWSCLISQEWGQERWTRVSLWVIFTHLITQRIKILPHSSDKDILIKKSTVWMTPKNSYSGESRALRSAKHGHRCHELSQRWLRWLSHSVRHTETSHLRTRLHALVAFVVLSSKRS